VENYFRKGNLIALRELALRRTADRVDAQMRRYMRDHAIRTTWPVMERLMACVGAGLESVLGWPERAMPLALATIALGCAVTVARRTARIIRALESA
jgi:K+-sensing histidine kinase KdpD